MLANNCCGGTTLHHYRSPVTVTSLRTAEEYLSHPLHARSHRHQRWWIINASEIQTAVGSCHWTIREQTAQLTRFYIIYVAVYIFLTWLHLVAKHSTTRACVGRSERRAATGGRGGGGLPGGKIAGLFLYTPTMHGASGVYWRGILQGWVVIGAQAVSHACVCGKFNCMITQICRLNIVLWYYYMLLFPSNAVEHNSMWWENAPT